MKLGFIGTGNLASAIIRGVVSSKIIAPENILIFDVFEKKTEELKNELSVCVAASANEIVRSCDGFVMAVKPKDISALLTGLADDIREYKPFIISTAAGTEIKTIASFLSDKTEIIRIMPNINAAVGESMTAVCPCENVRDEIKNFAFKLCECFGKAVFLDEKYFSVFSAIACCAPAFAYMFEDALSVAGIKYGLTAADARKAASQMLLGSAKMLLDSPLSESALIRNVTSPGGTTVEGICSLKENGFENAVIKAVEKAVEKDLRMAGK